MFTLYLPMPSSALTPPSEEPGRSPESGGVRPRTLTDALRQALAQLGSSAIGVTRGSGGPPKYFTRNAPAAQFFEDICSSALPLLQAETQTKGRVFGSNRVRADSDGPVRGRMIAVSLRDPQGAPLGILVAVRLIEEAKFGAQESQTILALAPEFETLLMVERLTATSDRLAPEEPGVVSVPEVAGPEPAPAQVAAPPMPAGPVVVKLAPTLNATRDPRDTFVSLLDWAAFERQIHAQETDEQLPGCVLYGDIDQLHVLNKLAGFAIGDRAIADVGGALQTADLPRGACACHLSGDRYTVYLPHTTLAQGRRIAERLSKSVSSLSVMIHGASTPLSISFGVALIPSDDGGLGHALAAAEAACKAAKDRGRGRVEVYQDADQSFVRRNDDVLVADSLRQALEAGRIEVFAQPIVRLNGAEPGAHYELLVRLISDAGTHISPAWFMSAATRYRMLVELDRAVIGHVLAALEAQRALLATRNLRFSVNLSGPSIGNPDFLEWLVSRVGSVGVPGEWLQFEITETAAVANVAQTQAMIRRLQSRGVQFALDDFGTGVSSFAYLKFFDVKMLKLDGSFVRDLLSNPRSESLVRGIAQLGRGMGIETVAECVESGDVRDRLTELGIDCAQGFLFGRPAPLDAVLAVELGLPTLPTLPTLEAAP